MKNPLSALLTNVKISLKREPVRVILTREGDSVLMENPSKLHGERLDEALRKMEARIDARKTLHLKKPKS